MNIQSLRELTDAELEAQLRDAKDSLFKLRFQLAMRQLEHTHKIGELRHRIAQIQTVRRERQLAAKGGKQSA